MRALGRALGKPKAIVVVSPHWTTAPGMGDAKEASYAREFSEWIRDAVARRDTHLLEQALKQAPHAQRAHPTTEHFQERVPAT